MRSTPKTSDPFQTMMQMISGYWTTQIVRGAARYSLADHLAQQPLTAQAFANAERLDEQASARFLRACESLGPVIRDGSHFSSTPLLDTLRKDSHRSLRGVAISQGAPGHWLPWGRFADALMTGERQTLATLGADIFDYYGATPEEAAAFTDGMAGLTAALADDVGRLLDTTGLTCAVDVGGAAGILLLALLRANPSLKGIVFDLPFVVPAAEAAAREAGLDDRVQAVAGDFFEAVPEGDLYVLKSVLVDWDDVSCIRILSNCRQATLPGGRVAIVDYLIGSDSDSAFAHLVNVNMLVMLTGRVRTIDEHRMLLAQAEFGDVTVTQTSTGMSILLATAV